MLKAIYNYNKLLINKLKAYTVCVEYFDIPVIQCMDFK